jgi:hypothetical protein
MLLKIPPFALYTSLCQYGIAKQIMLVLHILCYNGSLATLMVISLTMPSLSPARVRDTLRLVVYHQSVCLGTKPLEAHYQHFF